MEILKYLEIKTSYVTNYRKNLILNGRITESIPLGITFYNQKLPTKDSNLVRQLATRLIPSLLHLSEGKPESVQAYVQRLEQE